MRGLLITLALVLATGCRANYTGGAHPVSPNESLAGYVHAAPTPVVKQRKEADCGLAALAMLGGAWGQTWTVDELAKSAPPTDKGVKLGVLRDLARQRGLEAYAISATLDDLVRELKAGRPVLLGLVLPFQGDNFLGHYEVAVAIDPKKGDVVTLDPASGRQMRRERKVLETEWARAKHAALVVTGQLARPVLGSR